MTEKEMIEWIAEAYEVFRRLPDPERRFLKPKMAAWPMYVRDAEEIAAMEKPARTLVAPTAAAIDRAFELLDLFAEHLRDYPTGAKVLWLQYGRGLTLSEIAVALRRGRSRRGYSRTTLRRQRQSAMSVLLAIFNKRVSRTARMDTLPSYAGVKRLIRT
jgi:hypothetical protein